MDEHALQELKRKLELPDFKWAWVDGALRAAWRERDAWKEEIQRGWQSLTRSEFETLIHERDEARRERDEARAVARQATDGEGLMADWSMMKDERDEARAALRDTEISWARTRDELQSDREFRAEVERLSQEHLVSLQAVRVAAEAFRHGGDWDVEDRAVQALRRALDEVK